MKIANAPCSWGILEFGLEGKTNGYQDVLDEMSATSYAGTELGDWGFMPTEPDKLKKELHDRHLQLVGAFVPVNFINRDDHRKGLQLALKTARLLSEAGSKNLILSDDNGKDPVRTKNAGRIRPEHGLTPSQWETYIEGVHLLARHIFEATGVSSSFHHHCAGYVETPEEIRRFLDMSDPDIINLCFDTGHYAFGGGDPVQGLKNHAERIKHVHFKDWDQAVFNRSKESNWDYFKAVENGVFCELGKGSIDFKAVLKELKKFRYSDWIVVEQDILPGMGTPKESAARNREFLRTLGL